MYIHIPYPLPGLFSQLDPGQTYNHQLSFVFFYKGHYQVEFKAYVLSTLSPPQNQQHRHVSSPPFSSSSSSSPSLPLRTTEETDGGKTSRSYIEQRVTSPILTSCPKSPTQNGESLLEYCGKFGGPVFAPLKITPCPFRCKLVPLPAEDVTSAALTSSSQARTDKLLPISEAGEIVKKEARLSHQESPSLLAKKEQISLAASSPGLVRRERGTRRHLISYSSMHKRLSHLCKRQVSGPVLSLQVVESRTSRHRSWKILDFLITLCHFLSSVFRSLFVRVFKRCFLTMQKYRSEIQKGKTLQPTKNTLLYKQTIL